MSGAKEARNEEVALVPFRCQVGDRIFEGQIPEELLEAPFQKVQFLIGVDAKNPDKQSGELPLKDVLSEERDKLVQQLLFGERVTKTVVLGNKVKVVFEAKTAGEALDLDVLPADFDVPKGAMPRWAQDYETVRVLASAIKTYNGRPIGKNPEDQTSREEFIRSLPNVVVGYLARRWNEFLNELGRALEPDVIGGMIKNS